MLNKGAIVAEVARHCGITETIWHRSKEHLWRDEGPRCQEAQGALARKPAGLKAIVADQALDIDGYKELNQGKFLTPSSS